jgi:hypothetical protein
MRKLHYSKLSLDSFNTGEYSKNHNCKKIRFTHAVPRTCHDVKLSGVDASGPYLIDPDGPGIGEPAFMADCDLSGPIGKAVVRERV